FFSRPEVEYQRVIDFLGLSPHVPERFDRWNARPGSEIPDGARRFLVDAFREHDEGLTEFLGHAPTWQR
ncbi:MAG: sulfotransferase, partial [Actinomycetes bacterium]